MIASPSSPRTMPNQEEPNKGKWSFSGIIDRIIQAFKNIAIRLGLSSPKNPARGVVISRPLPQQDPASAPTVAPENEETFSELAVRISAGHNWYEQPPLLGFSEDEEDFPPESLGLLSDDDCDF
jgi:hypothetical protein